MSDSELTPVANAKFAGILADEINRLTREIKQLTVERDDANSRYLIAVGMLSTTPAFSDRSFAQLQRDIDKVLEMTKAKEKEYLNDEIW